MKWFNQKKTLGLEINDIAYFQFIKADCFYIYNEDVLQVLLKGSSKLIEIFGTDAKDLYKKLIQL